LPNALYSCPAPARLPVDFVTDGFYADNDPTHSIIDPVKQKAYEEGLSVITNRFHYPNSE
jgi:poly(beta-D-mannuronate) lyase